MITLNNYNVGINALNTLASMMIETKYNNIFPTLSSNYNFQSNRNYNTYSFGSFQSFFDGERPYDSYEFKIKEQERLAKLRQSGIDGFQHFEPWLEDPRNYWISKSKDNYKNLQVPFGQLPYKPMPVIEPIRNNPYGNTFLKRPNNNYLSNIRYTSRGIIN